MITVEFNYDREPLKLNKRNYDVYPDYGCLYIKEIKEPYAEVRYIFPLNMIKCVTF